MLRFSMLVDIYKMKCYYTKNTLCTAYKSTVQTEQAMVKSWGQATEVATDEIIVTSVGQ